jgi:hypothetical protein
MSVCQGLPPRDRAVLPLPPSLPQSPTLLCVLHRAMITM